jgi:Ni2+-binding GTPase involved in maturation of urease and hydrogenase
MSPSTSIKPVRFVMVGGFLGAGKTTTIGKLAAHYVAQGKNVSIVTNDQAFNLVDTETLRRQGFHVGEVPGACFCCKFDDLLSTVDSLSEDRIPDLIIAEPVGSCTDLVATVIEPMKGLFGDRFETGPLVVLLKPSHGKKILSDTSSRGFSAKAEYIFLKQLEEADSIAINKVDRMSEDDQQLLLKLTQDRFPDKKVILLSAREGTGFDDLVVAIESEPIARTGMMEMDYEIYAEGEAELGWLNCQVKAKANEGETFELDEVVLAFVREIGTRLVNQSAEVAHLKVLGQTLENSAVANMVSSDGIAEISLASEIKTEAAELLVNARIATSPEKLSEIVNAVAGDLQASMPVSFSIGEMQSFRPGKPEPTHRMV